MEELRKKVLDLCIDIYAHDQLDYEITLCGNVYIAFECSGVADKLLEILGVTYDDISKQIFIKAQELGEWDYK